MWWHDRRKVALVVAVVVVNFIVLYFGEARAFMVMGLANGLTPLAVNSISERRTTTIRSLMEYGWQWLSLAIYGALLTFVVLQLLGVVVSAVIASLVAFPTVAIAMALNPQQLPAMAGLLGVVSFVFGGCPCCTCRGAGWAAGRSC